MTGVEAEIQQTVTRINDAWLHLRGDALSSALQASFAEDVVIRGPGFVLAGKGRDFAVHSYQDFVAQALVKKFNLEPPDIDVCGETATAQYKWAMTYVMDEHGRDVLVFARRQGRWLVVWRAMLPETD